MQFLAVQQFPRDIFPALHAQCSRQGPRQVNEESQVLAFRPDRLDSQRIGRHSSCCWHTVSFFLLI